jgi:antitoxin component YwqK of YwqJK toxin-antitoxin module
VKIAPRLSLLLALLPLAALAVFLAMVFRPAAPPPSPNLPEMTRSNLWRQNDRWCLKGGSNQFTGVLLDYYPNGALELRSLVSNGMLEGLSEGWYTNRQLQVREFYRTNFSNGPRTKWYPDGQKQSESTIVAGQMQGLFRRWYDNGKLAEEIPMKDGKIEGLGRSYYQSGAPKSEIEIHQGQVVRSRAFEEKP